MGVCCYNFLKYMVMIFNLIYMMLGAALLGTSLWVYIDASSLANVTKDIHEYNYVLFFLMAVGAIMLVMGFLGCCGACQESQCMLATFFALVFVLFVGQIAGGIWMKMNEDRFYQTVTNSLAQSIKKDYGRIDIKTKAFDVIQTKLKCCGAHGPSDWAESSFNDAEGKSVPEIGVVSSTTTYFVPTTCCKDVNDQNCERDRQISLAGSLNGSLYQDGCAKNMLRVIEEHSYEVLGVIATILLIEILAMIFSLILCCTVRRIDNVKA